MTKFQCKFWLPAPRARVFPFFSSAWNLQEITPPWLRFHIITPGPIEVRRGTMLEYRLRVRGLPISWRSEITAWEPPARFVDEQRQGPFKVWIHEHVFEESNQGTLVSDQVTYGTFGGRLVERFLVAPDIRRIFAYREERLRALFPPSEG